LNSDIGGYINMMFNVSYKDVLLVLMMAIVSYRGVFKSSLDKEWRASVVEDFKDKGFVIIPNLLSDEECDRLLYEASEIVRGNRGHILGIDSHFIQAEEGVNVLSKVLAIHFPHKISSMIREDFLSHHKIVKILQQLMVKEGADNNTVVGIKAVQSMLFIKSSGKPGQAWHQDEHYIPTRDQSLIGVWLALDEATEENGCLWMRPGSHKSGEVDV
jgi:phytanoyl-CoA hydroxylase